MKLNIKPGRYILAVSGGVDSVVLLDLLSKEKNVLLIVAHFDHGIRQNSKRDRDFVKQLAAQYGLVFEAAEGKLGAKASEETARKARYSFLYSVKAKHRADAIITAHHQDDVLETLIINLMRGTGRKGLSSLQSTDGILRPMLDFQKKEIIRYAKANKLSWHEDETNKDTKYLRNWVRARILPNLTDQNRFELLKVQSNTSKLNIVADDLLDSFLDSNNSQVIAKKNLVNLPHKVAVELIAHWLRKNELRNFDTKALERILIGSKILQSKKVIIINKQYSVLIDENVIYLRKHKFLSTI